MRRVRGRNPKHQGRSLVSEEERRLVSRNASYAHASYLLTFDLYRRAYGRIAVDAELRACDLADMFSAAWMELNLCGYHGFYITRVDGEELTSEEVIKLEKVVEGDLFFDYGEDEVSVWFDDSRSPLYLYVDVSHRDPALND